jgi:predicted nucleic acid-binding protein
MIHLDTNFLIGAATRESPLGVILQGWLLGGESLAVSSIAWTEFLNGPVDHQQIRSVRYLLEDRIVPFGAREAEKASELFNRAGRKRGSMLDGMIAATAICAHAGLATQNRKDFAPFVSIGLRLA